MALGFVAEGACYSLVAEAAGLTLVDLAGSASSELAVRLVPERLARRHSVVPLARGQPDADLCHQPSVRPGGRARSVVRVRPAHAAVGCAPIGPARSAGAVLSQAARSRCPCRAAERGDGPSSRARKRAVDLMPTSFDGHRPLQSHHRPCRRGRRERRARRVWRRGHDGSLPHLRSARAGADAARIGLTTDSQSFQDHGEGGHRGTPPPAGRRVPPQSERSSDRCPTLDAADG